MPTVDGQWGPWSEWSNCSKPCDTGTRSRSRQCDAPAPSNGGKECVGFDEESEKCNIKPCPTPCPSGWSEFEGNCYKYFDNRMNWTDARDFCLSAKVLYYLTNKSEMLLTRLTWFPFTLIKKVISWPSSPLDISSGLGEIDHAHAAKTFCGLTGLRWTTRFGRLV